MSSLVGQAFPEDVAFTYVPYVDGKGVNEMCGMPIKYDATKGKSNDPIPFAATLSPREQLSNADEMI